MWCWAGNPRTTRQRQMVFQGRWRCTSPWLDIGRIGSEFADHLVDGVHVFVTGVLVELVVPAVRGQLLNNRVLDEHRLAVCVQGDVDLIGFFVGDGFAKEMRLVAHAHKDVLAQHEVAESDALEPMRVGAALTLDVDGFDRDIGFLVESHQTVKPVSLIDFLAKHPCLRGVGKDPAQRVIGVILGAELFQLADDDFAGLQLLTSEELTFPTSGQKGVGPIGVVRHLEDLAHEALGNHVHVVENTEHAQRASHGVVGFDEDPGVQAFFGFQQGLDVEPLQLSVDQSQHVRLVDHDIAVRELAVELRRIEVHDIPESAAVARGASVDHEALEVDHGVRRVEGRAAALDVPDRCLTEASVQ